MIIWYDSYWCRWFEMANVYERCDVGLNIFTLQAYGQDGTLHIQLLYLLKNYRIYHQDLQAGILFSFDYICNIIAALLYFSSHIVHDDHGHNVGQCEATW